MSDGPIIEPPDEAATPMPSPLAEDPHPATTEPPARKRSLFGVLGIVAVVIVLILVLLLLRDCVSQGGRSDSDSSGDKTIESVEGLEAVDGVVSVWLAPGTELESVIENAGIESLNALDVDGERFVIEVTPGGEEAAIDALKEQESVFDAGRVYQAVTDKSGTPGSSEPSPAE